jgi:CRISPR/Cas system-associated endonuclease Cas3-HD
MTAIKAESEATNASPLKSAREELDFLRKMFRDLMVSYSARIEGEIAQMREAVVSEEKKKKNSSSHLRDARDIITLIRTLDVKTEKGRRRDLKKIDLLIEELNRFVENW